MKNAWRACAPGDEIVTGRSSPRGFRPKLEPGPRMNRRILLVDDHADFLEGERAMLAPHFDVELAHSGAEALARIERYGPYAVVVSDYGMPGMSGVELLCEVSVQWPDTARILLTGCADLGLALEALERGGIFRFLTKPPDPRRLVEAVTAGVQRYDAIAEERLFTEQLSFARESLQTLNGVLEQRLERELAHLNALAQGSERIAAARSAEDVLEKTTEAVRELFGAEAPEVRKSGEHNLEIVPSKALPARERRALSILASSARGALAATQRRDRAREAQLATLRALQHMARERDDATGMHLARVSAYTKLLARGVRATGRHQHEISEEFIEDLGLAAPLHDIGKVAVPDAILFKPGKLDEREWEVMRTHASVGAEILRGVQAGQQESAPLLFLARQIAWTHHERWDGTGYPRGLAREAIPLAGRIMALADCYDALTSERPYKPAWSHQAAVAHLREQRGLAFDPELVDVFLAHEHEFEGLLGHRSGSPA
jgi:response regulator RpfG family c-di-GMP phosphodiesterase